MTTDLDRKAREQFNAWLLSRGVVITDMHRRLDMFEAWKAALRLAVPDGYRISTCMDGKVSLYFDTAEQADAWHEQLIAAWDAAPTLADEGVKIMPCRCFTPREKELCLHKRECSVVTAHSDEATP